METEDPRITQAVEDVKELLADLLWEVHNPRSTDQVRKNLQSRIRLVQKELNSLNRIRRRMNRDRKKEPKEPIRNESVRTRPLTTTEIPELISLCEETIQHRKDKLAVAATKEERNEIEESVRQTMKIVQ